ncbi:Mss4-like protein [Xylogone sp. PMI_703]|nr:Mss4-like protein [Xylogone sp. PMI_703]
MAEENKNKSTAEGSGKEEQWKFEAPYRVQTGRDDFVAVREGSCHCGKVKYQLKRKQPLASKYCHCTTCQTAHGAPFQWAAIFNKDDINFLNGYHNLSWYHSQEKLLERKLPCKVSCSYCHSPIMDEGRNMILLFPTLIKFKDHEDKKSFAPTCHIFYGQRVVTIPDGKPKWSGLDGQSDLVDDSPQEAIDEHKARMEKKKSDDKAEVKRKEKSDGNL